MTSARGDEPQRPGWWTQSATGEWHKFEVDEVAPPREPKVDGDREVPIELTDDERRMLVFGLIDWGGPTRATNSLAVAMGFSGLDDLKREAPRIADRLQAGQPLTVRDWSRTLFATELIFASAVFGTGSGWTVIQGGDDAHWIRVLRQLQQKLPASREFLGS